VGFQDQELIIEQAFPHSDLFQGFDFVLSNVGDQAAEKYVPTIVQSVALNVDKSGAWSVAVDELKSQEMTLGEDSETEPNVIPHQIAKNVIPAIGSLTDEGLFSGEIKLINETRKIFHEPNLPINAICVRVPVLNGHSEAVHMELQHDMDPNEALEVLVKALGIKVVDNPNHSQYPTPIETSGKDDVFVGRIRKDPSHPRGISMWIVADNLRKGATLNTYQVFELVTRNRWLRKKQVF
jgi:aspartate-semialdehyde dehydrogenase